MGSEVGTLLGQDSLGADLLADLLGADARAVRLTGPSGSGKSHVARLVAERWCEEVGACVVAVGDDEHSSRELYPLLSGLSRTPPDWSHLASVGTRSAVRIADSAAGGMGAGATIFDVLTSAFRQKTERTLKPYSAAERDVILDLRRLARADRLLLIADNCHWWDVDSLHLLNDLLSKSLREQLPQLERIQVLIVDTADEQEVVAPAAFESVCTKRAFSTYRTKRCSPDQFAAVLEAFGIETRLPDELVRNLFSVTHGHLKLAQQIAAYAKEDDVAALVTSIDDDYLAELVAARFASLGSFTSEVTDLLVRAAVLGLSFTEKDLICIAETKSRAAVLPLLERAESIGFMEKEEDRIGFSHDVIRAAILDHQAPSTLKGLYAKLAECLALLRPADYSARAHALIQADDSAGARDMYALTAVAQVRRGVPASRVIQRVRTRTPDDRELIDYLETIAVGYAAVDSGDYTAALGRLRVPIAGESKVMAAERNYLIAICSMLQHTAAGAKEARSILTSWLPDLDSELALELRFLLLLQQAQLVSEMFDAARDTEGSLERRLLDRRRHDAEAAMMLQVQNRRAGAINAPESAEPRIEAAVRFFEKGTGDSVRDRLELFRSLTNLAAIQLRLGKDAEAYRRAKEAELLVVDSPDLFGRLDVLASNLIVAGFRCREIELAEAVSMQRQVVANGETEDGFLERCNLSAFLLLAAEDEEADAEIRRLRKELRSFEFEEGYLVYYCSTLTVANAALRGEAAEALRLHRELGRFVKRIKWPNAPHVRRRQELLEQVLAEVDGEGPREVADRILLDRWPEEIGKPWAYYGRLIPCVELSFWSDS
ncbi:MAG TPA: ATP-binding protein [Solirubrobacterales bacterium]|nr:ATP-binding protein [Solirubrobacterales bacterium]